MYPQTIFPSQLRKWCSPTDSLPTLWQTCTCPVRVSLMNVVFVAKFQVSKWEWVGRNFSRCNYTQISVKPQKSFPIRDRWGSCSYLADSCLLWCLLQSLCTESHHCMTWGRQCPNPPCLPVKAQSRRSWMEANLSARKPSPPHSQIPSRPCSTPESRAPFVRLSMFVDQIQASSAVSSPFPPLPSLLWLFRSNSTTDWLRKSGQLCTLEDATG